MTSYTWAWIGWIVLFVVIEGLALTNQQSGDTLSEHVWAALRGQGPRVKLRRFLLLTLLAWLIVHFLSGGWM